MSNRPENFFDDLGYDKRYCDITREKYEQDGDFLRRKITCLCGNDLIRLMSYNKDKIKLISDIKNNENFCFHLPCVRF